MLQEQEQADHISYLKIKYAITGPVVTHQIATKV